MCSQILFSRQIFAISGIGSTLAVDVVPTVAITASGFKLFSEVPGHSFTQCADIHPKIRIAGHPHDIFLAQPSAIAAFSAELCA